MDGQVPSSCVVALRPSDDVASFGVQGTLLILLFYYFFRFCWNRVAVKLDVEGLTPCVLHPSHTVCCMVRSSVFVIGSHLSMQGDGDADIRYICTPLLSSSSLPGHWQHPVIIIIVSSCFKFSLPTTASQCPAHTNFVVQNIPCGNARLDHLELVCGSMRLLVGLA
ncbi:hypothetical protein BKA82DRAFT_888959 [Pisolithus tinctorius]|uniref:Uncharacterized protein n=1 Tax=Pisolithus tinctorius Marx 270 TaxID=870435 RepID=A0A0C3NQ84_PISTI|nr:hypothetical protein BKA82DRAFT_888959 [Pisolithus tinctorius]KIN97735.1 hypothetical protein M404DRAFT_888959 [Pisolithus tinctorius Marx 270]